jgi:phospholipid/cholesterol/gamma-HCH transport system substrate-binding protein
MIRKINFEFVLGILILIITLLAFITIFSKTSFYKPVNNFSLESSFFDIGQLDIGSDVKINGVKVGEVKKIYLETETYMAVVKTSFTKKIDIPLDSSFKIANNGFVGSPYLEISLGTSPIFYKNNELTDNNIDAISLEEIINNFIFK